MNIRPETPRDYAAIGDLHVRAFGRTEEAVIVPLLRQRRHFDPGLSLVAEIDGRIVGHALFSPYTIRLSAQDVRAVNLAPIAVDTNQQKQGIGGALINEGHRIALSKSYSVSFLLGHDTYYPRFGYKTGVYGVSSVEIETNRLPANTLQTRPPVEADISNLCGLWRHEEYGVDFSIFPGTSLLDWISPNPAITATVFLYKKRMVGYMRVHKDQPDKPRFFIAVNDVNRRFSEEMCSYLAQKYRCRSITLPLHPLSDSANYLRPKVQPWKAGMACSLAPSPFDDYYAQLQEGKRLPGRVIWPVAFDLA